MHAPALIAAPLQVWLRVLAIPAVALTGVFLWKKAAFAMRLCGVFGVDRKRQAAAAVGFGVHNAPPLIIDQDHPDVVCGRVFVTAPTSVCG